jgi:hypothetical protein
MSVPIFTYEEIRLNGFWDSPYWAPGFSPSEEELEHEKKCEILDEKLGPLVNKVVMFSDEDKNFHAIVKGICGSYVVLDVITEIPIFHKL